MHTLLGQALLESGHALEAIDALKVSTKLDPSDPLPRVQLIKAYLVLNLPGEAMRVVDECRRIVGNSIELECLAAMAIIAAKEQKPEFCERTLKQFGKHLHEYPYDFEAFALAMDVASKLARRDWGQSFSQTLDLREGCDFSTVLSKLPAILKKMNELRWHDVAQTIIDKSITVCKLQGTGSGFTQ